MDAFASCVSSVLCQYVCIVIYMLIACAFEVYFEVKCTLTHTLLITDMQIVLFYVSVYVLLFLKYTSK